MAAPTADHREAAPTPHGGGCSVRDPGRLAVQEQEVAHPPMGLLKSELPDGYARAGAEVQVVLALNHPSRSHELLIDLDPGLLLASQVVMLRGPSSLFPAAQDAPGTLFAPLVSCHGPTHGT